MTRFPCPYLKGEVELSESREKHITENHPDLLPDHRQRIALTLADPDLVRRSSRFGNARLFARWYNDLKGGKHVVAVVISEAAAGRHCIVTAYIAGKLGKGKVEWQKN